MRADPGGIDLIAIGLVGEFSYFVRQGIEDRRPVFSPLEQKEDVVQNFLNHDARKS